MEHQGGARRPGGGGLGEFRPLCGGARERTDAPIWRSRSMARGIRAAPHDVLRRPRWGDPHAHRHSPLATTCTAVTTATGPLTLGPAGPPAREHEGRRRARRDRGFYDSVTPLTATEKRAAGVHAECGGRTGEGLWDRSPGTPRRSGWSRNSTSPRSTCWRCIGWRHRRPRADSDPGLCQCAHRDAIGPWH